ncbi:MAG: hypothetical protein IPK82_23575 [Polyangiaceae bacterium]|nr:hypothetical protein [Polyangiaceae bacterium]
MGVGLVGLGLGEVCGGSGVVALYLPSFGRGHVVYGVGRALGFDGIGGGVGAVGYVCGRAGKLDGGGGVLEALAVVVQLFALVVGGVL